MSLINLREIDAMATPQPAAPRERLIYPCPSPWCSSDLGSPFGTCSDSDCVDADIKFTLAYEAGCEL